jgi:two-component system sensor kinase FixL
VITPCAARGARRGALAVATRGRRHWEARELEQIRTLAEVLSNASAREEAEFEVQWMRQELAQVARLVSLGELTSSLAHELNQPLTGILCNAQAAARILQDDEPCHEELSAIVSDIVDDNRRASEVIQRMRDVLSQDNAPPESLDLNQIVRDVASLITSETIIRNVSVTLRLTADPVTVRAARAELQQAVLNVLTYAIRAVADRDVAERLIEVVVEAAKDARTPARVTVRHPGVVVVSSVQADLLAPCFVPGANRVTTGLDVARVIVERNGGTIAADSLQGAATAIVIAMPKNES